MVSGVVTELRPRKPIEPIARTITGEAAKVHGNRLVNSLRLSIGLRMEGCTHLQPHIGLSKEVKPHMAGKNGVAITDNGVRKTMKVHDVVEEGTSNRRSRVRVPQWNEVGVLGEPVDDGEDDTLAMDLRKGLDEVHRNVRPHTRRHGQRLQETGWV